MEYKKGDILEFTGYGDSIGEDDALFSVGDKIIVHEVRDDGALVCAAEGAEIGDTVFPEEVRPVTGDDEDLKTDALEALEADPAATTEEQGEQDTPAEVLPAVAVPTSLDSLLEGDVLAAAKALVERAEQTYFTLGGVLRHIRENDLYLNLGYTGEGKTSGFAQYVENELGVHYRKARYLINIHTKFTALGIPESRLAEIGWSKAKELLKIGDTDQMENMIDYAKGHTRAEVQARIEEQESSSEGSTALEEGAEVERVRRVRKTLMFDANIADIVQGAIDRAKENFGVETESEAIAGICSEWASLLTAAPEQEQEQEQAPQVAVAS